MEGRYDAIVVGGGVMGTAAAWQLAGRGRSCVLLEQFRVGHDRGSSHGPTRIFRISYHHPDYVRMARRALEEWRALEAAAGEQLLHSTGSLDIGPGALTASEALSAAGERFEWLAGEAVHERWPAVRAERDSEFLFQADGAICTADRVVRAQARLAASQGAVVLEETPVQGIAPGPDGVEVRTPAGAVRAPVAVLTPGPWAGPLLRAVGIDLPLTASQEQVFYFEDGSGSQPPALIEWTGLPVRIPYAVPDPTHPGAVKLAEHMAGPVVTPDSRTFDPDPASRDRLRAWAERRFIDLRPTGEAQTCLYTNTPDEDFVIDRRGTLVLATGFSGHGFKFAPLVGRICADLATGEPPPIPLDRFSAARFEPASARR
jgi:sarcosine oxidase